MNILPCLRTRLRIWSRETGSAVPSHVSLLILHTQTAAYSRNSSRVPRRRPSIYFNRHAPSGQSRVYRVTQLRTDGVHCRESVGTGSVNLKVVPKRVFKRKNQSTPRPSEHPPVMEEKMSKRLGGIKGCKYKTSSWHSNRFPDADNIGSTV